jgi:hypothetical protein
MHERVNGPCTSHVLPISCCDTFVRNRRVEFSVTYLLSIPRHCPIPAASILNGHVPETFLEISFTSEDN